MKILYFSSGAYPTSDKPYGGIFIKKQLEALSNYIDFDIFSFFECDGFSSSFMKKLLKKKVNTFSSVGHEIKYEKFSWKFLHYNRNLFDAMIKSIFPNQGFRINKRFKIINKKINIEEYDLIHAHFGYPSGYLAYITAKKFNKPYIITLHGSDIHTNIIKSPKTKELTFEAMENAEKCIFVSEILLKKAIETGYSGNNSIVIRNGVDNELFRILEDKKVTTGKKKVAYIGNLKEVKGIDRIPAIFYNIKEQMNDVEFYIIGNGGYKEKLFKELSRYNIDVDYKESIDNSVLPEFLNFIDLVIMPSRNEGLPLLPIETNMCGIPVLASDVGGLPEIIKNNDYLVNNSSADFIKEFSDKALNILSNSPDKKEIRDSVLNFSLKTTSHEIYEIYKNILNKDKTIISST